MLVILCGWLFSLWLAVFSDNSEQMLILADHHQKLIHRRSLRYPDRIPHNVLKVCWQWKKKFSSIPQRNSDLIRNGLTHWNLAFCKNFSLIFCSKLVFNGFSQLWLYNIFSLPIFRDTRIGENTGSTQTRTRSIFMYL